jgi:hypothetical protein
MTPDTDSPTAQHDAGDTAHAGDTAGDTMGGVGGLDAQQTRLRFCQLLNLRQQALLAAYSYSTTLRGLIQDVNLEHLPPSVLEHLQSQSNLLQEIGQINSVLLGDFKEDQPTQQPVQQQQQQEKPAETRAMFGLFGCEQPQPLARERLPAPLESERNARWQRYKDISKNLPDQVTAGLAVAKKAQQGSFYKENQPVWDLTVLDGKSPPQIRGRTKITLVQLVRDLCDEFNQSAPAFPIPVLQLMWTQKGFSWYILSTS